MPDEAPSFLEPRHVEAVFSMRELSRQQQKRHENNFLSGWFGQCGEIHRGQRITGETDGRWRGLQVGE